MAIPGSSPGLDSSRIVRKIAARIPNARLVITGDYAGAVDSWLREDEPVAAQPQIPAGMTAILFADIADSTALTERLGDDAFRAK